MREIEEQLHKEDIDVFAFKLMDDAEKLEVLENHYLNPEDFSELFDTCNIDELRKNAVDDE